MMKVLSRAVSRLVCVTIGVLGISFLTPNDTLADIKAPVFGWIKDSSTSKWWYKNSDGTYPTNSWVWLDGDRNGLFECYFFDNEGWMLSNTTTPDGYTVDESGAWTKDGQVERRTEEELKNPKVAETKAEEEKPKAEEGANSESTDPTVPIHIPEPKEVEESELSKNPASVSTYTFKDGLAIYGNKIPGTSIGGFISDDEFEELAHYARSKGFINRHKSPETNTWVEDKLSLIYRIPKGYNQGDPNPNVAHAYGRKYTGNKYVELHLWMDEGKSYGTYSLYYYDGDDEYVDGKAHTKVNSKQEMKDIIDYAANHKHTIFY